MLFFLSYVIMYYLDYTMIRMTYSDLGEEDCGSVRYAEGPGRHQVGSGLRRERRLCLRP